MNQYKGGKGADRQGWLSLWNGAAVLVNRKTRKEAIVLDNPLVGVTGCLLPDMLGLLTDAAFPENLRGPFAKFEGYGARLALILRRRPWQAT